MVSSVLPVKNMKKKQRDRFVCTKWIEPCRWALCCFLSEQNKRPSTHPHNLGRMQLSSKRMSSWRCILYSPYIKHQCHVSCLCNCSYSVIRPSWKFDLTIQIAQQTINESGRIASRRSCLSHDSIILTEYA